MIEAVKKLNEVTGVRGIRRFFKQIAQSAKGADQDDFLGCITIPIQVKQSGHVIAGHRITKSNPGNPEQWLRWLVQTAGTDL